jgi:hypothetical protein
MTYTKVSALDATGWVQLRTIDPPIPESEYLNLEYMDWKSGGDTNFAPIASAEGELECAGFWDHGKPDKDGVWTSNAELCPTIVEWVERVGANFGRVRTIKLEPQDYETALKRGHLDDNNRLNPDGEGWVVRAWLELTDNPDSFMILREDPDDPATETRIPLPRGAQFVVDTERMWHVVCHPGTEPRYALIASFESGGDLERWIESELP